MSHKTLIKFLKNVGVEFLLLLFATKTTFRILVASDIDFKEMVLHQRTHQFKVDLLLLYNVFYFILHRYIYIVHFFYLTISLCPCTPRICDSVVVNSSVRDLNIVTQIMYNL